MRRSKLEKIARGLGPAVFLLPLAVILAAVAAAFGKWLVFVAMVFVILGQTLTLWGIRRRRGTAATAPRASTPPSDRQAG